MYRLLHKKSSIECHEQDEKIHNQEILNILDKIAKLPYQRVKATFYYVDKGHKHKKPIIMHYSINEVDELYECCDTKNGVDFATNEDKTALIIICHGQGYTIGDDETYYLVEEHILIEPL